MYRMSGNHTLDVGTLAPLTRFGAIFGANTFHLDGGQFEWILYIGKRCADLGCAADSACSGTPDNWLLPVGMLVRQVGVGN